MKISITVAMMLLAVSCSTGSHTQNGKTSDHVGKFSANHSFSIDVPEGAKEVNAWFAMPSDHDAHQKISDWQVVSPHPTRIVRDERGNNFLFMTIANPTPGTLDVTTSFNIERQEVRKSTNPEATRPHDSVELARLAEHLKGSSQSVIDKDVRAMADRAVGNERNPIRVARLLYDAVLDHVEYHVKDPNPNATKTMNSSGTGSSAYTLNTCTGNCTDFHSLYAALARSRNIPTRAVYGSFFKGPLDGVDKDQSYHCWLEFHAPNIGWIPLDVAVADIFTDDFEANEHSQPRANLTVADGYAGPNPMMVDYYFGNIDARRVVWHRGRDLVMKNPRQKGAPLLWNPKAHVEIDGTSAKVRRALTYRSL